LERADMTSHGGIPTYLNALRRLTELKSKIAAGKATIGDAAIPGFRHFLGEVEGTLHRDDRFRIFGELPTFDESSQRRRRHLMGRLAHRMSVPYASDERDDNTNIPAGYTYLLQLMAHDLVQSSVSASILDEVFAGARNHRQARLRLDTIYGAGPDSNALYYAGGASVRNALRMGRMAPDPTAGCPFRDIPRFSPGDRTGETAEGCTDALIADSRNDDHAILSQLTTLFHLLHNGIVTKLLPQAARKVQADSEPEAALNNFFFARAAVTMIYRSIIRNDVMQKILHPDVYRIYQNGFSSGSFLEQPDDRIPLEFSHAAFRFAHAMVRPSYKINDGSREGIGNALKATSLRNPQRVPLARDWIIDWSNFFVINRSSPNFSQWIRPKYVPGLVNAQLFPELPDTSQPGLACRDLVSSVELGLWSVDRLIERLANNSASGIGAAIRKCVTESPFLMDRERRRSDLAAWLVQHPNSHSLRNPEDVSALAHDPPLMFFIQYEAWAGDAPGGVPLKGATLGILGSIIVADVIFAALADGDEEKGKDIAGSLENLNGRFFGSEWNAFKDIPDLTNMSNLVSYIGRLHGMENADPRFV
jgi:hypothetical protein